MKTILYIACLILFSLAMAGGMLLLVAFFLSRPQHHPEIPYQPTEQRQMVATVTQLTPKPMPKNKLVTIKNDPISLGETATTTVQPTVGSTTFVAEQPATKTKQIPTPKQPPELPFGQVHFTKNEDRVEITIDGSYDKVAFQMQRPDGQFIVQFGLRDSTEPVFSSVFLEQKGDYHYEVVYVKGETTQSYHKIYTVE